MKTSPVWFWLSVMVLVIAWFPLFRALRKLTHERGVHPFDLILKKKKKTTADKALLIGIARASVVKPYTSLTPHEIYFQLASEWDQIPEPGQNFQPFCAHCQGTRTVLTFSGLRVQCPVCVPL